MFTKFKLLGEEIAHSVRSMDCVLDGELVCLDPTGRSQFYNLLLRREWPYFAAFDVLRLDGEDLRRLPLRARKRRLRAVLPRIKAQEWCRTARNDLRRRAQSIRRTAVG